MIVGNLDVWNELEFRRRSRQLDLLARGDFSPIKDELAVAYPRSDLPVRAIPFVQRYVAELSGLYTRPVVRRFRPFDLPTEVYRKLQAVYRASRIDRALDAVEQALWTQNTVLLVVLPSSRLGRVRVQPILPWQVENIDIGDPLLADDPASWDRLVAGVPASVAAGQVVMGRMELTRAHAWRHIGGERRGIYSEDGTHPFARVPVLAVHRIPPDAGRWAAPVNEAVLNLQISLSLQAADDEQIVRHCAYPQKVIQNASIAQLVEEITVGPDKVVALVRSGNPDDPPPTLSVVQGQVPVSELVTFAEHKIRLYCSMLGMDPSTFIRVNTAVTASARLFAAQDRAALRERIQPVLRELETDLARWIVAVLALREPLPLPADLGAEVQWVVREPEADPASAATALRERVAMGLASPADVVARAEGLSRREATARVERNLKEAEGLGLRGAAGG